MEYTPGGSGRFTEYTLVTARCGVDYLVYFGRRGWFM